VPRGVRRHTRGRAPGAGDKEAHIDALIARAKELLGATATAIVFELGLNTILDDIRDDLELFGVRYDEWYSERSLTESGAVNRAIERLRHSGHLYEKTARSGSAPPPSATRRTGWWCATTARPPISPPISPITWTSWSAASSG
jgi:hypothetical protein